MVDKDIIRNQSGYYDGTAGRAILNAERKKQMSDKTGEVWKTLATDGMEYNVVIVKDHGGIVSVLRLKDERAVNDDLEIVAGAKMYADCRKVYFLRHSALTDFVRALSDAELQNMRQKVSDVLDLKDLEVKAEKKPAEIITKTEEGRGTREQLAVVTAQLEVYQKLYGDLLARVV